MRFITLFLSLIFLVNLGFSQIKNQVDWQQQVDYMIDVTLDDQSHFLNGEIAINYTNNSPDELKFIYFHIWPNAYKNNQTAFAQQMQQNGELDFYYSSEEERGYLDSLSFSSNGESLKIEETDNIDVLKVVLNSPLKPGEKTTLFTPFRVKIPKVFSRLGHEDQDYFITQWYPKPAVYDVNGWNPMPYLNLGEFYSEFGSFKVSVTLPANYVIAATGECETAGELEGDFREGTRDSVPLSSDEMKTVIFSADKVHDFAWFASKRFGYVSKEVKVGDKKIIARIVSPKKAEKYLSAVETAITYYSEHVGPYPYSHATVVHGELKAGGGMEYPMITLCDFLNDEVIVHEVGHNWFYGILASNERVYPWMDESINSFYDHAALGAESKLLSNDGIMRLIVKDNLLRNEHQAVGLHSEKYTSMNYGASVYGEGAAIFKHLEAYLGEERYKKCMQNYYEEWKFRHPLPDDMKASFEKTSSRDLSWFFDVLINTDQKLDYAIKLKKDSIFLENKGGVEVPMPVTTFKNNQPTTHWVSVPSGEMRFVALNDDYDRIVLDKDQVTSDLFVNNNQEPKGIELKLGTGQDKKGIKELYVYPQYAWNAYDKSMLGFSFHNQSITNKPLAWHISPLYSFNKKSVNGTAELKYTMSLDSTAEYIEFGAMARSFNFIERHLVDQDYKYLKVAPYISYHFPKSSQRSPLSKELRLQYDQIWLQPSFELNDDTLTGPQTFRSKARNFATLTYKLKNERAINPYSLELMAEYGGITNRVVLGDLNDRRIRNIYLDTTTNEADTVYYFPNIGEEDDFDDFIKLSAIWKYNVDIGIKEKPLELRIFGSYLIKSIQNTTYKNSVGSTDRAGYYDYRFDDYLMHRNADYGLFQNQISNRRDFSKFVGPIASADKWLISANVTVPLPGKIPLKPYFEILTFNDIRDPTVVSYNPNGVGFFYNVGLEFEVKKDRFEIFINLAQSEEITNFQESSYIQIDKFWERITFVFDLNGMSIPNFKKRNLKF